MGLVQNNLGGENDNFSEIVEYLSFSVDLGAGQFSMTPDRTKVVQFSRTFGVETNTILMNAPGLHQAKNIFDPFDKLGWYRVLYLCLGKDKK